MNVQPFAVAPESYSRPLDVVGVRITVLASNAATRGYEVTLQEGGEGAGPPPHRHAWDETFFVLRGSVECACAGKTIRGVPGTLVHVPGGTVHGFRFGAGGGAMLEISGPGGRASELFGALDREIPPGPPDIPSVIAILERHGATVAA